MTRPFRLGVLTRVYAPDASPRVLHDTLALIDTAEAPGFASAWVAQHHFGRETGRLPSPLVLLAAAAPRTPRIPPGTRAVPLPLPSVPRPAEDAQASEELERYMSSHPRLARYKRPRDYRFVDTIPYNATGEKVHERAAEQAAEDAAAGRFLSA